MVGLGSSGLILLLKGAIVTGLGCSLTRMILWMGPFFPSCVSINSDLQAAFTSYLSCICRA